MGMSVCVFVSVCVCVCVSVIFRLWCALQAFEISKMTKTLKSTIK